MANDLNQPLVSVVIPTRNRAHLLCRAVDSVLQQDASDWELIIVDDASKTAAADALASAGIVDPRIEIVRNERPGGACAARNAGMRLARGRFITFLDDDDEFLPARLSVLCGLLVRAPEASFVCSNYFDLRRTGTRVSRQTGSITRDRILWGNAAGPSIVARRDWVEDIGGFDTALSAAQDLDLYIRLIMRFGPAQRDARVLFAYHQEHDGERISTRRDTRLSGYFACHRKHRDAMSAAQRRYSLYRLMKLRGRAIPMFMCLSMVPPRMWLTEIHSMLIERTPVYRYIGPLLRATARVKAPGARPDPK